MFAGPIPKVPKHGRIKEKYRPTPTAREKAFHLSLIGRVCACGCGRVATLVHHVLRRHPLKRWRRDHEMVVPMASDCHCRLHLDDPREEKEFRGMADLAAQLRAEAYEDGRL